jgi:hypothetical protein
LDEEAPDFGRLDSACGFEKIGRLTNPVVEESNV